MPVTEKGKVGKITCSAMDPMHQVCPEVQVAGRSQLGHTQCRSRTLSALRVGPQIRAPGAPFKLHLSGVRPRLDQPITKAEDPRGLS